MMPEQAAGRDGGESSITVFHLVWAPFGPGYFVRFLESYRTHPAGIPHRLHFLYNGFDSADDARPYEELLGDVPHDRTVLSRPVQDINAYFQAARAVNSEFLCFANSYACILSPDWLSKLHSHARRESVGLVGATGTFESQLTEVIRAGIPSRPPLGRNFLAWPRRISRHRTNLSLAWEGIRAIEADFPSYPNPHIRTNGFMLRRSLMLSLEFGEIICKDDAYRFESGRMGLTRRINSMGLDAVVVGSDGKGYPVHEWPTSNTFRSGKQVNLLIADNQTQLYDEASPALRQSLATASWGEGFREF